MSCLIYAKDEETQSRVDIDELYEKEHRRNNKLLSCFNKILHRIHKRIYLTSKTKYNDKHIFYTVPVFILGEPQYDIGHCIAYLVNELQNNDFLVKYIDPNTLYVSWHLFIPQFIREQVKQKTGKQIDKYGHFVEDEQEKQQKLLEQQRQRQQEDELNNASSSSKKKYKSTEQFKPTGNFVYNSELFDRIERRIIPEDNTAGNSTMEQNTTHRVRFS